MRVCTPLIDEGDAYTCSPVDSVVDVSISSIMLIMAVIFVCESVCVCVCAATGIDTQGNDAPFQWMLCLLSVSTPQLADNGNECILVRPVKDTQGKWW